MSSDLSLKMLFQCTALKDVMKRPADTVNEDEDFSVAYELIIKNHLTHLCVVDESGHVVGILSHKYAYRAQSPRKILNQEMKYSQQVVVDGDSFYEKETLNNVILKKIMSAKPRTLKETQSLLDAVVLMHDHHLGCVPIVDQYKKLQGVVTDQDIVRFVAENLGR